MENENKDSCSCCSNLRIHEDFVPSSELVHGKDYDTLLLSLPGFKKEEIKVQLCKTGILKISGQRPVNKCLSFQKHIPISTNCDKSKINASLVNGILYIKHPKLIISSQKNEIELPTSTNKPPKQDNKKTTLDELSKHDNVENSLAKQEEEEPKNISPKTSEQIHEVKQVESMKDTTMKHATMKDDTMKDATTRSASDLLAKLKVSRKVMNIALAALVFVGVGGFVMNVMRSHKKAKE